MPLLIALGLLVVGASDPFYVRPYLQLGADDQTGRDHSLTVMWFAKGSSSDRWSVEFTAGGSRRQAGTLVEPVRRAHSAGVLGYRFRLSRLPAGASFRYQVTRNGKIVFSSLGKAPMARNQSSRIAIWGDSGRGLPGQRAVATQMGKYAPDFMVHVGDIVYPHGTEGEYLKYHFPVYNADQDGKGFASLLRKTISVATPGNHDTAYRNLSKYPGALAYYWMWDHPVKSRLPDASEIKANRSTFDNNPGNFSFAYGAGYWVSLDSNTYLNWKSNTALEWLDRELSKGASYPWRFVVLHHAPYHSSEKKKNERYMTSILSLLTKHRVAIVFSGHVHNYQVSYPISYDMRSQQPVIDRRFDGRTVTRTPGTLFVVTGSGGAELYDQKLADDRSKWKPFTRTYLRGYSFTTMEMSSRRLSLAQVDGQGREIDRFVVAR